MSARETGGPAFPWTGVGTEGLSLRDYFAAQAMQGLLAATKGDLNITDLKLITRSSYFVADTMLSTRSE